ncbi:MAG: OmpH family outer membrane protein [Flavobacteriales bacterium]|nr:OmpH family outer membrane protein [Flavobacteriales bacterium]
MKKLLLTLFVLGIAGSTSFAQKIAFADVNAILSVMPENKAINEDLQIYATGLQKRLDDMKAQLDGLVQQFNTALAAKDTAKALEFQKQAIEGDKAVKQAATQAEQQLAQKRSDLLQPALKRIRTGMEAVAKRNGFEYVLNSVDGSGTSSLLWGPEGTDITRKVVAELGIKLEGDEEAAPATAPAPEEKKKK